MQDKIWVTRDKQWIRVSDMTTSHITNCIRMIRRNQARGFPWRIEYLGRLELELEIRALKK